MARRDDQERMKQEMNAIYCVVWSVAKQCAVVTSEFARKQSGRKLVSALVGLGLLAGSQGLAWGASAITDSTGKEVKSGNNAVYMETRSDGAIVIGDDAVATERQAIAIGDQASVYKNTSGAIGKLSKVYGSDSYAIGTGATIGSADDTTASDSVAIGTKASVTVKRGTALGKEASVTGQEGTAIGYQSEASGSSSLAMGGSAEASADRSTALGTGSTASGSNSTALGTRAQASGQDAFAGGSEAQALSRGTVALGANSRAASNSAGMPDRASVAIGYGSIADGGSRATGLTAIGSNSLAGLISKTVDGKEVNDYTSAEYNTASGGLTATGEKLKDTTLYSTNLFTLAGMDTTNTTSNRNEATAIGQDARALGDQSVAIGAQTVAGNASVAIGGNDIGSVLTDENRAKYAAIVGHAVPDNKVITEDGSEFYPTTSAADGSVAIGQKAISRGTFGTALGTSSMVTQQADLGTAIGAGAQTGDGKTSTAGGTAIGAGAYVVGDYTTAIATGAEATAEGATAVGYQTKVSGTDSTGLGRENQITAANSAAVGNQNQVTTSGTYVLGSQVGQNVATLENSVYLGDSSTLRQNAGTNYTAAGAAGSTTSGGATGTVHTATVRGSQGTSLTYSGFAGETAAGGVSVGSAGAERRISNVAAGEISSTSTDAINGSQLYTVAGGLQDHVTKVATGLQNQMDAVNQDLSQVKGDVQHLQNAVSGLQDDIADVGAESAALAGLQSIQYDPLEPTQFMAAAGTYRGSSAAAIGIAHYTNERTMFHAGVALGSHTMANVGVTWKFGHTTEKDAVPTRYKAGPISSVYVLQDEVTALKQENAQMKEQIRNLLQVVQTMAQQGKKEEK